MRKSREILRLHFERQLTNRQIARVCQVSRSTVADYLARFQRAGVTWPLPEDMNEGQLDTLLFGLPADGPLQGDPPPTSRPLPEMDYLHRELRRKHVTLKLLWEEHKADQPNGLQYSQFCERYHQWKRHISLSMRQEHKAGDKLFIDYAGTTVPVYCRESRSVRQAQLFVAVLGASSYTYAEATWTQELPNWIASHVRTFEFIQGTTACLVPDNLRSAVSRACRYEPDLNPTYQALAEHYGTAVIPARPSRPKDKATVEGAVLIAERSILAALRNQTFLSLGTLNEAIRGLLVIHNNRKFQRLNVSRAELFAEIDKPALQPLPAEPFRFEQIKKARVNIDYHVDFDGHLYSVPYKLTSEPVEVRVSPTTVEILHNGKRVAAHQRSFFRGKFSTLEEHRPEKHQAFLKWTPERIRDWALKYGPSVAGAVEAIIASRPYPEQAYRSCLGVIRLGDRFGKERLEAACQRALQLDLCSFRSIRSILDKGLYQQSSQPEPESAAHRQLHVNVRGAAYYRGKEVAHAAAIALS